MLTKPRIRIVVPYQPRVAYVAARAVCSPTLPAASGSGPGSNLGSGSIVCLPTYSDGGLGGPVNSSSVTCFKVG